MEALNRITHDPNVMGGRACIRGMRVTVSLVLNLISSGVTSDEITEAYPYLDAEDIRHALKYAAWLAEESIHPLDLTETHKQGKVTEALNELYSQEPSGLDEDLAQMQWPSLPRGDC